LNGWPGVDLHLDEQSPAIDAGTSENAPSEDCEGKIRPAGNGHDIGAYEYGSAEAQENDGDEQEDPEPKRTKKGTSIR
jgi:hypothetical protein